MVTPEDIQAKEFSKSVRGYKEEEVDVYLDMITLDLEKILNENSRLKAEVAALEDEVATLKEAESQVAGVLEQARQLMGDISVSAEKRADILLRNAELDAELTVRESRERAERLRDESRNLERRYKEFRNKYKQMLENELFRFENLDEDMYPQFTDDKLEALINAPLSQNISDLEKSIFGESTPVSSGAKNTEKTVVINFQEGQDS